VSTAIEVQQRIKKARLFKGISRRQLALSIGKGNSVIGEYETGKSSPPLDDVYLIAEVLGVNVEWLLTGATIDKVRKEKADKILILQSEVIRIEGEINFCALQIKSYKKELKAVQKELKTLGV
jgi:transcriptional regulator with XRE-family HTH domain